jgi:glucose-1-phosphate thymidylyltransferase
MNQAVNQTERKHQKPTVLLLAGGFATRLWPLTEKRAKPLLPLAGKALIRHILDGLPKDFPIIISTNKQFEEAFLELQEDYPQRDLQIFIEDSASDKHKKGALAATSMVIDHFKIDNPLLLIAGDNYFGFSLEDFWDSYDGRTLLASYDTKSLEAAKQFGVLSVENGKLASFVEKPQDPPSTLISTGCYLFEPDHLTHISDYSQIAADNLGGIFEYLLEKNAHIDVFPFEEDWIDIGSFESYLQAHAQLLKGQRVHKSASVKDSELGQGVDIGADCIVENSMLDQVIIMEGCTIRNSRLRGCVIDKDCVIEGIDLDRKMLREGTVLRAGK